MYGWIPLLSTLNYHNIVYWLYSKIKSFLKEREKIMFSCSSLLRLNFSGFHWFLIVAVMRSCSPNKHSPFSSLPELWFCTGQQQVKLKILFSSYLPADWTRTDSKVFEFNFSCAVRTCRQGFPTVLSSGQWDLSKYLLGGPKRKKKFFFFYLKQDRLNRHAPFPFTTPILFFLLPEMQLQWLEVEKPSHGQGNKRHTLIDGMREQDLDYVQLI